MLKYVWLRVIRIYSKTGGKDPIASISLSGRADLYLHRWESRDGKWRGTLQQYLGRLSSASLDKRDIRVIDLHDTGNPMLESMWRKRMQGTVRPSGNYWLFAERRLANRLLDNLRRCVRFESSLEQVVDDLRLSAGAVRPIPEAANT